VGSVTETITVTAELSMLQTETTLDIGEMTRTVEVKGGDRLARDRQR